MSSSELNIAQICPVTEALGPGKRVVVWVQGCPFSCSGCVAPDWIPIRPANQVKVADLAKYLIKLIKTENLEGITISGGEPMLQAGALAELIDLVRATHPEFSAIVFSGYTLSQLRKQSATKREKSNLLARIDILIDGLYVETQNDAKGLRGSHNQQIYFLSDRYQHLEKSLTTEPRRTELHMLNDSMLLVGVPSPQILSSFRTIAEQIRKL